MKLNDLTNIYEDMSQHTDVDDEMSRIAAFWKQHSKGMSDDDLAEVIGNDLEQLEYSPEEAEKMIPKIVRMIKA